MLRKQPLARARVSNTNETQLLTKKKKSMKVEGELFAKAGIKGNKSGTKRAINILYTRIKMSA